MPHKKNDRSRLAPASAARSVVEAPKVRVVIGENNYGGVKLADASFLIRRGRYHYMRWRDGERVREFYLGVLKESATQAAAAAGGSRAGGCVAKTEKKHGR